MDPLQLVGTWRLQRQIEDHRGEDVTVTGLAEFTAEADGRIRWHESGTMHHVRTDLPFTRTMFLVPDHGPDQDHSQGQGPTARLAAAWHVTFEDGRYFHPWPGATAAGGGVGAEGGPTSSGMDVVHVCTPDLYRGEFSERSSGRTWTLIWRVTGPRKDYVMSTDYTRL